MTKEYYDGARAAIQAFREASIEHPVIGKVADIVASSFDSVEKADIDSRENEPLELNALVAMSENGDVFGVHVWVKELSSGYIYAAITDFTEQGLVAIWCAHEKKFEFDEPNYGKTWVAYLHQPKEEKEK